MPDTPTFSPAVRGAAGRFFIIAGLCGLAVAQPVLDVFGASPSTFQNNRATGSAVAVFAVLVVLVPPVVLWAIGEVATRVSTRLGRGVHLATIATLAGIFGVLIAKDLASSAALHVLFGLIVGVGAATAYAQWESVRSWLRLIAAANVLFFVQFAFLSDAADVVEAESQPTVDYELDLVDPPSVLMVVLDELPTQSIITADGGVDQVRFPNLAALADESTWYRRFTTVSPLTQTAVPGLLDGRDPSGNPTWQDHPDSLFTLLDESHHLIVTEAITNICGLRGCGVRPVPPPTSDDATVTQPPVGDTDDGTRWGRLFSTAREAWIERVRPGDSERVATFDDFVEEVVETGDGPEAVDPNAELSEEDEALEFFLGTLVDQQPRRQIEFVDALRPTPDPFFGFLHLILPHQPWSHREDGTVYDAAANRFDFEADNGDPWSVAVGRQRHLLQAAYTDRLIGQLVDHLRDIGEYDDTLIVVVADHGAVFEPGRGSRQVADDTVEQIAYGPLFIKRPGQRVGIVSDANVNSTDIVPTIASLIGTTVPWEVDGLAVDGDAADAAALEARGSGKYIYSFSDAFTEELLGIVDYDDDQAFDALLEGRFPAITATDDVLAGLYRPIDEGGLIGESAAERFGDQVATGAIAAFDLLRDPPDDAPLLGEIAGHIDDAPSGAIVAVAVNDLVVGLSPLYERDGRDDSWVVLLPADVLERTGNSIRVALVLDDGSIGEVEVTDG